MPPKRKTKAETLSRVRENQRRCRARRQEYIAELERKLERCKAEGPSKKFEIPQDTLHKLEEENRRLRELLSLTGVDEAQIDTHISSESHKYGAQQSTEILPPSETSNTVFTAEGHGPTSLVHEDGLSLSSDFLDLNSIYQAEDFGDLFDTSFLQLPATGLDIFEPEDSVQNTAGNPSAIESHLDVSHALTSEHKSPNFELCESICSKTKVPTGETQEDADSTLCTVAYDMVRQHNKKGIDMIEIGIRLWNGFIKAEGGCKVENKLLYSVLEFISGEKY